MAKSATSGLFFHLSALLLVFVSTVLLFLTVLMNIPLPFEETPSSNAVRYRAWLLTVDAGVPIRQIDGPINGPIGPFGPTSSPDDGTVFGFGIWGWCQWTHQSSRNDNSDARCIDHPFYNLGKDPSPDDPVRGLDLP
ncbi:hypothetical protein BD324DRAFT_114894 [Kockovaella imperatae]|uniref:Uncharacterized protein n=1 Tax=Kockovaella imperatae TaxID=4999 RepID=A0A1Y1UAG5_9TREE|nr:hypothetical protein BD324DRAFT_114894 [Kockovaella imperatae]ORX35041.1 hypothetical protein BD324DRAFT_114894 [Kockovaella imperatae]